MNELARILGMPAAQVTREFRAATGERPSAFLKGLQIARAQRLLRFTGLPLNRVGYASGFGTRVSFFRLFRQLTGTTPREFRRRCRERSALQHHAPAHV